MENGYSSNKLKLQSCIAYHHLKYIHFKIHSFDIISHKDHNKRTEMQEMKRITTVNGRDGKKWQNHQMANSTFANTESNDTKRSSEDRE